MPTRNEQLSVIDQRIQRLEAAYWRSVERCGDFYRESGWWGAPTNAVEIEYELGERLTEMIARCERRIETLRARWAAEPVIEPAIVRQSRAWDCDQECYVDIDWGTWV